MGKLCVLYETGHCERRLVCGFSWGDELGLASICIFSFFFIPLHFYIKAFGFFFYLIAVSRFVFCVILLVFCGGQGLHWESGHFWYNR